MGMARYDDLLRRTEQSLAYWVAGAEIEFTEELSRAMEENGVSRAELARRIGSSQAYITKVLRGNVNFTMATMVKLVRALDMELKVRLAPRDAGASSKDGLWDRWETCASIFPRTETATPAGRLFLVPDSWRSPARSHRSEERASPTSSSPGGTEGTYGGSAVAA